MCDANVPETYEEAINSSESIKWEKAMQAEINSLENNKTWEIFKIKSNGVYKARVVARGFQQMYQENEEIYSPVAFKVLLSTACICGWNIEQMGIETAFLNGNIKSEVYTPCNKNTVR